MNIRYKLTRQDLTTYNCTKWVLNEWKETDGTGKLCTGGWLHCYTHPLLAILLNPIHANINNPKLFKCEVEGKCLEDKGLKEGWTRMRIIEEIEIPQLSPVNKIAFGILCALEVCKDKKFVKWANNWLKNKDRSIESAYIISNYLFSFLGGNYSISYYATRAAHKCCASYCSKYKYHKDDYLLDLRFCASVCAEDRTFYNIDFIKLAKKAMEIK